MYIHREGNRLLISTFLIFTAITVLMFLFSQPLNFFNWLMIVLMYLFWLALVSFFRIPRRIFTEDSQRLIAPADGVVCNIEQVFEKEYLNCECLIVSIFMSATDVHVNRYPADGTVEYVKYHKGNYFIASYPKSSIMNERSSVGLKLDNGQRILLRQVAGVMARRIVCYAREGERVKQNQEMGFIKFGSRVDIFLPLDTTLNVALEDVVRNGITPFASLK